MANSQLRDHSRWLKNYLANPEQYGSATVENNSSSQDLSQLQQLLGANSANTTGNMLQMMMLMMMYQMMGTTSPTLGVANQSMAASDPFQGFPQYQLAGQSSNSQSAGAQKAIDTVLSHILPDGSDSETSLDGDESGQSTLQATDSEAVSALMNDWEAAGLNDVQFGQTIMYLLHQGDEEVLNALSQWLPELFKTGELQALPLLQADYIGKLDASRQSVLSGAIADAGIAAKDGAPNSALISSLISKASAPLGNSTTQAEQEVARDIIRNLVANASIEDDVESPSDLYLPNLLYLSGFNQDDDGQWSGPFGLTALGTVSQEQSSETV